MNPKKRIFTVANLLTFSRVLFLPVIVYYLIIGQRITAFIIMCISLLTDTIDGFLARRLNQETEFGKFLDPVCDKLSLAVILITLFLIGAFPIWGLIIIISRDILILIGSFIIWRTRQKVYKSNMPGRITGVIFGLMILAFTLNLFTIGNVLLYVSIPAVLGTFIVYFMRYVRTMKGVA